MSVKVGNGFAPLRMQLADGACVGAFGLAAIALRGSIRPASLVHFGAFKGNLVAFAANDSLTEARSPTSSGLTYGFASGPAFVSESKGAGAIAAASRSPRFPARRFSSAFCAVIMLFCSGYAAQAADDRATVSAAAAGKDLAPARPIGEAAVRIIAFQNAQNHAGFSAVGLPIGLAIDRKTGVISGKIDREANRNEGAPFAVNVIVNNGAGASGVSRINLQIENRPPVVVDDELPMSIKNLQLNVLANDTDPDGDRLVLTSANASYGAVEFSTAGLIVYAQDPGSARPDVIRYQVSDGHGGYAVGNVAVSVP